MRFVLLLTVLGCWLVAEVRAATLAKTNIETTMTVTMDGGSARKKLPAGTTLEVLQDNGDNLQVKDGNGLVGSVAKSAVSVAVNETPVPVQATPTISPESSTASSGSATAPVSTGDGEKHQDKIAELNKAFGIELFADDNLW